MGRKNKNLKRKCKVLSTVIDAAIDETTKKIMTKIVRLERKLNGSEKKGSGNVNLGNESLGEKVNEEIEIVIEIVIEIEKGTVTEIIKKKERELVNVNAIDTLQVEKKMIMLLREKNPK